MQYEQLTKKIIGCAFKVYNTLGFGYLESVYQKSMLIELHKRALSATAKKPVTVYYDEQIVGDFLADIMVDDVVLVELKSVTTLHKKHEVQLVNYLTATKMDVGLLINFGEDGVQVKRKVRLLPGKEEQDLQD